MRKPIDRNGQEVYVGDEVKIVKLKYDTLNNLSDETQEKVKSMIGGTFEVNEIDEYGGVWVHKEWWNEKGDECESHGLSLSTDEMELVS